MGKLHASNFRNNGHENFRVIFNYHFTILWRITIRPFSSGNGFLGILQFLGNHQFTTNLMNRVKEHVELTKINFIPFIKGQKNDKKGKNIEMNNNNVT